MATDKFMTQQIFTELYFTIRCTGYDYGTTIHRTLLIFIQHLLLTLKARAPNTYVHLEALCSLSLRSSSGKNKVYKKAWTSASPSKLYGAKTVSTKQNEASPVAMAIYRVIKPKSPSLLCMPFSRWREGNGPWPPGPVLWRVKLNCNCSFKCTVHVMSIFSLKL